jgi:membrane protease YdiL (CAAX protease family)
MFVFLAFIACDNFLVKILCPIVQVEVVRTFLSNIITRALVILFALIVIFKVGLADINGLRLPLKVKNLQAYIVVVMVVVIAGIGNYSIYRDAFGPVLLLFILSGLLVGLAEELIMRGIVQPLIIRYFIGRKGAIMIGVILTSLMFGLLHFFNLIREPGNFLGIFNQVLFAVSLGLFFGGLVIRTENILPVCLIHGFINVAFGLSKLKSFLMVAPMPDNNEHQLLSLIITSLIFILIGLSGVMMVKFSAQSEYMIKLQRSTVL